jgi:hypothetical protein
VRFEVLMAVTVRIKILWDVTPCIVVDIYWQLEKLVASINKVEMMEASFCFEIPVHIYHATWRHIPEDMHHQGISNWCLLYNMLTSVKDNKNIYLLIKHITLSPTYKVLRGIWNYECQSQQELKT